MRSVALILLAVILSDSMSTGRIWLKEKYGESMIIDSVTTAIEKDRVIYVTRNKRLFGVFPMENWSVIKLNGGN